MFSTKSSRTHGATQMSNLVDGKIYIAPNGIHKLKIYPHGFIEKVSNIPEETMILIKEMSSLSLDMLLDGATPYEVFEQMGWTPEQLK